MPLPVVGTNPVSGMTLMTLILVTWWSAWKNSPGGMVAALVMGGVVCAGHYRQ